MSPGTRARLLRGIGALVAAGAALAGAVVGTAAPSQAAVIQRISGAGSTWSGPAIKQWAANVRSSYGWIVDYDDQGSTYGRNQFKNGQADFGVSEIPYGQVDAGAQDPPPSRGYAYMPIVAGGTSFTYNLRINGRKVTNLRLSGPVVTGIFTGTITTWNAPAIARDNPGLRLPARRIVPVVRSDGSGTSAQFTLWMSKNYPDAWNAFCRKVGRPTPCGLTSNYPAPAGFVALAKSDGVSNFVKSDQSEGSITYVEFSYPLQLGLPVVKLLNRAGYYVEPKAPAVAVALTAARINDNASSPDYLTQILDGVYANPDPRSYPLSSYSYMIIPTKLEPPINANKGYTLSKFAKYFLCEGQRQAERIGYSPLPINLVRAGFAQVNRIPNAEKITDDVRSCNNPTFTANGQNQLALTAPQPKACDRSGGGSQCPDGTGGLYSIATAVSGGGGTGGTSGTGGTRGTGGTGGTGGTAGPGGTGGTGAGTAGGGAAAGGAAGGAARGVAGTGGGAAGAGAGGGTVDPDTGQLVGANGDGGTVEAAGQVAGNPLTVPASYGDDGLQRTLVVLSVLLLLGLAVGPPLASRLLSSKETS